MTSVTRPNGWYSLSESKEICAEVAHKINFDPGDNLAEYMAYWNGASWSEVAHHELDTLPILHTLSEIKSSFGYSRSVMAELLRISLANDMNHSHILDYLANFPIRYGAVDKEPQFDSRTLSSWVSYARQETDLRPDFKFSSLYVGNNGRWGEPEGLDHGDVNFLLPRPESHHEGLGSEVTAAIGLALPEDHPDSNGITWPSTSSVLENEWTYQVMGWTLRPASSPTFPRYEGFTAAESFVISQFINYGLSLFPLPLSGLSVSGHMALKKALRIIHSPGTNELDSAKSETVRETVRSTLERNYGFVRTLDLNIGQVSRLDVLGHDCERGKSTPILPRPRLVKTFNEAEEYAASIMIALGFSDVEVSRVGSDEGIDVSSFEALAQVKMEGVKTSREKVQRLTGVCSVYRKSALFFSLSGYSGPALDWAEKTHTACFEFHYDGSLIARSRAAMELMRHGA